MASYLAILQERERYQVLPSPQDLYLDIVGFHPASPLQALWLGRGRFNP